MALVGPGDREMAKDDPGVVDEDRRARIAAGVDQGRGSPFAPAIVTLLVITKVPR